MYGPIYPQKLQDKCLTRRARGDSDNLKHASLFLGAPGRAGRLPRGRRHLSRRRSPLSPDVQVRSWRVVGVSKTLLGPIGWKERLLASDWRSRWRVKNAFCYVQVGVQAAEWPRNVPVYRWQPDCPNGGLGISFWAGGLPAPGRGVWVAW